LLALFIDYAMMYRFWDLVAVTAAAAAVTISGVLFIERPNQL